MSYLGMSSVFAGKLNVYCYVYIYTLDIYIMNLHLHWTFSPLLHYVLYNYMPNIYASFVV